MEFVFELEGTEHRLAVTHPLDMPVSVFEEAAMGSPSAQPFVLMKGAMKASDYEILRKVPTRKFGKLFREWDALNKPEEDN